MKLYSILFLATLLAVSLLVSTPTARAGDYQGTATFSLQDLTIEQNYGFDCVLFSNDAYITQPGAPALPLVQINVAIPTDATVLGVRVRGIESVDIQGRYDLLPATKPQPISIPLAEDPFRKDPGIYSSNDLYPGVYAEVKGAWDHVGQDFVTLNLYPVQYNPVTQKLLLTLRFDFVVEYQEAENPSRETYNFTQMVREESLRDLKAMAFNPEDVADIPPYRGGYTSLAPGNYDYVIITDSSFESGFQPLVDWRTQMGMPATMVNTSWVYANYTGSNNRTKIRNFMIDANTTWGARYFLLGGDTGYLPYHSRSLLGQSVPNDTFYADCDDDWRYELWVGRACVNGTSQVNTFVNKVLTYEKSPPANYGEKVFFMGFNGDSSHRGEDCKIVITSNGWIPATADFSREYDSESGTHEADVKSYMNQGKNLVNHVGHGDTGLLGVGSYFHGDWLNTTEAQAFTNGTKYSNLYTVACYTGNYPNTCWAEKFVRDDQGGITYIGNSRYGIYSPGSMSTYSQKYDQLYWETLTDFNKYIIGQTFGKSLNKYFPHDETYKYVFTELNLLGDPALHLWTDDPADLTVSHGSSINTGSQTFAVNVKEAGADLEGALVCVMKDDEVYEYAFTDASGNVSLSIDPATSGSMAVTATAQNFRCYEGSVSVSSSQPPPTLSSITPDYGLEAGGTPVTLSGANFTSSPAMTVKINNVNCTSVNVVNASTLTCNTPAGTDGWYDVAISNTYGSDSLTEGFRYFPTGGAPFNAVNIHTESLDAPASLMLLISGQPSAPYLFWWSVAGGGPITTPYGTMGLTFPIQYMFTGSLNPQGYTEILLDLPAGYGPLDIYIQTLQLNALSKFERAGGGNNPNGSGSVWLHLNN